MRYAFWNTGVTAANDTQNSLGESQPSNESAAEVPQAHAWPNVPGEPDPRVKSKEECLAQAAIGWTLRSGRDGATEPTEPRVCIANWNRQGQCRPDSSECAFPRERSQMDKEMGMVTVKMLEFSRKCVEQNSYAQYHAERLRRLAVKIIAGEYI